MADRSLTKLITVSLGKIQQSKQVKHGLNLRRSILVASVLSQARAEYIAEIKLKRNHSQQDETQPQCNNYATDTSTTQANFPSPRKRKLVYQRSYTDNKSQPSIPSQRSVSTEIRSESSPDTDGYAPTTIADLVLNEIQTISEIENKENNNTFSQTIADTYTNGSSSSLAACRRCLKRSLSVTDSFTSTNKPASFSEGDSIVAKRIKPDASSDIAKLTSKLSNSFMEFSSSLPTHSSNITSLRCGASMTDFNCFAVQHHQLESTVALEA